MPLLSILILILAIQALPWPDPIFGSPAWAAAATLLTHAVVVLFGWWANAILARQIAGRPDLRPRLVSRYRRVRLLLYGLNVCALFLSLGVWGWGAVVRESGPTTELPNGKAVLVPFFELVTIAPTVVATILGWLGHHRVEWTLRQTIDPPPLVPFFGAGRFVLFNLRLYALIVLGPVLLTACQLSFNRCLPSIANHPVAIAGGTLVVLVVVVLMPLALPTVLGLVPMRRDGIRERFEAVARRNGCRYRDILVWPTRGTMVNAFVAGLVANVRYIIVSDRLLDDLRPDEQDAVMGHEIGHVRHGHMAYFAVFLALSGWAITAGTVRIYDEMRARGHEFTERDLAWFTVAPIGVLGLYLFVAFGWLSRKCERQADLFGAKAVSCADPDCDGHDSGATLAPGGTALCRTGLQTMASALECVLGRGESPDLLDRWLERIQAWQHGPTRGRIDYLQSLTGKTDTDRPFQRQFLVAKIAIVVALSMAIWFL
jgi:Zn-dependent protease with chaperone function